MRQMAVSRSRTATVEAASLVAVQEPCAGGGLAYGRAEPCTGGGGAMDETLREIMLPGGQTVLARVTPAPGVRKPGGYGSGDQEIGGGRAAAGQFEQPRG